VISFIFKILIVALIVVGLYAVYSYRKTGQLPGPLQAYSSKLNIPSIPNFKSEDAVKNLSAALDQLVTHSNTNSPIVLGVKVTNDSLSTLVDVLQKLPTSQLDQLKVAICSTPSATQ
jgi:hypothetical protein